MVSSAPVKILTEFRNRFLAIIDPNLSSDVDEMRELAARTFIVVFTNIYDLVYVSATVDRSIMKKMHSYVVNKETKQADYLIMSLKKMFKDAPELKLEDKCMVLCGVVDKKGPYTEAQAKILTALAPNISERAFKKKFYNNFLNTLSDELLNHKPEGHPEDPVSKWSVEET
jgi:hypothetical protein